MTIASQPWGIRVQKIFAGDVEAMLDDLWLSANTFEEMVEKTQNFIVDDPGLFWMMPWEGNPPKELRDYRDALSTDLPEDPGYAPVEGQFQVEIYGSRLLVRPLRQRKIRGIE